MRGGRRTPGHEEGKERTIRREGSQMRELGGGERAGGSCRAGGKAAKAANQTRTAASNSGPEFAVKPGKEDTEEKSKRAGLGEGSVPGTGLSASYEQGT